MNARFAEDAVNGSAPSRALVLGAADEAEEMAAALRRLGLEVAVADDRGLSVTHLQDVLSQFPADVVVPVGVAYDGEIVQFLETTGIEVAPSLTAMHITGRRDLQLRFATEELGLPVARYATACSVADAEQSVRTLGVPCVISPACSADGIASVVTDEHEIAAAYGRAGAGEVVIDRCVDADVEVVMLAVAAAGETEGAADVITFCEPIGVQRAADGRIAAAWQPQETTEGEYDTARSVAARMVRGIGGRGLFAVRLFVRRGDTYFAGIDSGPHAAGVLTLRSQVLDQWTLHARALVGAPCDATMSSPAASVSCPDHVSVADIPAALAVPESAAWLCEVTGEFSPWQHGAFIASAETVTEARERAGAAQRRASR